MNILRTLDKLLIEGHLHRLLDTSLELQFQTFAKSLNCFVKCSKYIQEYKSIKYKEIMHTSI